MSRSALVATAPVSCIAATVFKFIPPREQEADEEIGSGSDKQQCAQDEGDGRTVQIREAAQ
ncbi:hypothetical protein [Sphingomonas faeni]|uniref:hypothetical protein n=1 Tax=Sphingomonas faeni TaxID=185950 RepID=UPI0027D8A7AA|nr:hypothetical protein [Sphingomonas faeni]